MDEWEIIKEKSSVKESQQGQVYYEEVGNWATLKPQPRQNEIELIKNEMKDLKAELEEMKKKMIPETVTVLRVISKEDAKKEIEALFSLSSEPIYYSDIAKKLNIDLKQVAEIVNELESEGKIRELDEE